MTDKLRGADRMNTTDKIMALADEYASAYGAWTETRVKRREALRAEIEALARYAERYTWLRNEADYLRLPQGSPQVLMTDEWGEPISTGKEAYPQKDGLDAAIDTAMQEKQS